MGKRKLNEDEKAQKRDPIKDAGRKYRLVYSLFHDFRPALAAIMHDDPQVPNPDPLTAAEQLDLQAFRDLKTLLPNLVTLMGEIKVTVLANILDDGGNNDRNVFVSDVKNDIGSWINFDPPLPPKKEDRGFKHDACRRLLLPYKYDSEDPVVQAAVASWDSAYPTKEYLWPRFIWLDCNVNPKKLHKGFLRHRLIVCTIRRILFGDAAAKVEPSSADVKAACRYKTHSIGNVTVNMILYAIILVHNALSSTASFNDSSNTFNYQRFYKELHAFYHNKLEESDRQAILRWYNNRVFYKGYAILRPVKDKIPSGVQSTADEFAEQLAQRKRRRLAQGEPNASGGDNDLSDPDTDDETARSEETHNDAGNDQIV